MSLRINIADDFSDTPDGRTPADSDFSGERFRKELLLPMYNEALRTGVKLEIYFDGCYGCPPSFLEEAFGGMAREEKIRGILDNIILIANDDETIHTRVEKYVREAEKLL